MEIIGSLEKAKVIIIDVDDTCYNCPEYTVHWKEIKFGGIGRLLGMSAEEAKNAVKAQKKKLKDQFGRKVALTETVVSMGISVKDWNDLRRDFLRPELFLARDVELANLVSEASKKYQLVFATNSPEKLGRKILGLLGIFPEEIGANFLATDMVNLYKPDPNFFLAACSLVNALPIDCISIGNRFETDCLPAVDAGFVGAVCVPNGRNETVDILKQLL